MKEDFCSFHNEFSQQVMGILNGIRGDVRWMLKIGGFVLVVCGAMLSLTFPLLRDLVTSMADIRNDIRIHESRIVILERNDEKLFAVKEKRDAQIQELLRKMETGH
jgi:hypothetical protein